MKKIKEFLSTILIVTLGRFYSFITMPQDKANHAFYGLVIYSLIALWNPMYAIGIVIVIGYGKEFIDDFTGGMKDWSDAFATCFVPFLLFIITYKF